MGLCSEKPNEVIPKREVAGLKLDAGMEENVNPSHYFSSFLYQSKIVPSVCYPHLKAVNFFLNDPMAWISNLSTQFVCIYEPRSREFQKIYQMLIFFCK